VAAVLCYGDYRKGLDWEQPALAVSQRSQATLRFVLVLLSMCNGAAKLMGDGRS